MVSFLSGPRMSGYHSPHFPAVQPGGLDGAWTTWATSVAAIRDFSRDGVSRVVIPEGKPPDTGPLADPEFGRVVSRGSGRVPVDRDGLIRRAAFVVPGPTGAVSPILAVALLARLGGSDPRALVKAASHAADGKVSLAVWRPDGPWTATGPEIPLRPGELWRISFVGPEKSFTTRKLPGE